MPRDFEDATSIVASQESAIDRSDLAGWARPLGVEEELTYLLREGG